MTMRCSVVIPTFHRELLLDRCLAALTRQEFDREMYEIIVADDGAAADTRTVVERRAASSDVRICYLAVDGPRHGPAAARNVGWRAARSAVVAFTDDDTVPSTTWLRDAMAAFDDPWLDAAAGRIEVPLPSYPTDYEKDAAGLETAGFTTANCFVRRSVLETLGGFDEAFEVAWREDSDLFLRLVDRGHRVRFLSDAVVVHPVRPARWGVSLSQQRKASFDALLYRKHPRLFAAHVRPIRPFRYYFIVASLFAAACAAVIGSYDLAAAIFAIWLLLTGAFAIRRLQGTSRAPSHIAEILVTSMLIPPLSLFWRARGAVRHRVLFW